jgi:hypothetical protein
MKTVYNSRNTIGQLLNNSAPQSGDHVARPRLRAEGLGGAW